MPMANFEVGRAADLVVVESLSTGPPDIQIESIAEGYIVVVVPQLQRGIQLSGYQTKNN